MAKNKLSDREIEAFLFEDIPSDIDSCAGGDLSDPGDQWEEESPLLDQNLLRSDDEFDSADEIPLAQLLGSNKPANQVAPLPMHSLQPPKWKKAYTILDPDNFEPSSHLPDEIYDLVVSHSVTPLKIFNLLWTDNIMQHIVFHTNLYAQQKGVSYNPVSVEEMPIFIALNLIMGIKKSPSYRD